MRNDRPPNFPIKPILEALGFEDVPDVRHGYAKVRCVLHGPDRTPSGSVSRYGYRCFTCGVTGDAIALIRREENCSYADALERCQELTGITDRAVPPTPRKGSQLLSL